MNTHEVYCSLDTCKLLKQAGFDWKEYLKPLSVYDGGGSVWKIPLHIAQKWLREVKNIDVYIFPTTNTKRECVYQVGIKSFGHTLWIPGQPSTTQYNTYEEAKEAGIKKALELILEKEE